MANRPAVAVIGAGITGLACAHRLLELRERSGKDLEIVLLEAGSRAGGTIETEQRDGFLLEKGPDAFIREKPWALALAKRLGLEEEVIGTRQTDRKSFILRRGQLLPIPEGFYLMAPTRPSSFLRSPLFSWPGKLRIAMEYFVPPSAAEADESLGSFVRRRFGRECLENAAQALVAGIYTADPDTLSLLATMPRFRTLEKKYGSVIRGLLTEGRKAATDAKKASGARYGLFVSFRQGMSALTEALEKKISPVICLNTAVDRLSFDRTEKRWEVFTESGEKFYFQAIVCSLPASSAHALFKESVPALSEELSGIRSESVATINFAYRDDQFRRLPGGFGYVSPKSEKRDVMACTFVDQKFEGRCPAGFKLLRAFMGGAFGRDVFDKNDPDLLEAAEKDLRDILGVQGKPYFSVLQRYPDAMVQYGVGHLDRLERIRLAAQPFPGLFLTGSSFDGVGIPDCVRSAELQAENSIKYLE